MPGTEEGLQPRRHSGQCSGQALHPGGKATPVGGWARMHAEGTIVLGHDPCVCPLLSFCFLFCAAHRCVWEETVPF